MTPSISVVSPDTLPVALSESADAVAASVAETILSAADVAIAERGRFDLVMAGGRTPLAAYTLLAERPAEWERWHIFLGDERCLPEGDVDRNSTAVARVFLDRVPIPRENRCLIAAELGAERAAAIYAASVGPVLPFDLVLLGMGEDGHTASLFPGHEVSSEAIAIPVHGAPKPPPDRVSLTPKALCACRGMLILATGSSKRAALEAWRAGADLPVARVASLARPHVRVLIDRDAAGGGGISDLPAIVGSAALPADGTMQR